MAPSTATCPMWAWCAINLLRASHLALCTSDCLPVIRGDELLGGDIVFLQGGGQVIERFLVALVGELPGAEVAGDGLPCLQLAEGFHRLGGGDVAVADPVRLVGADGDEGYIGRTEAGVNLGVKPL